MLLLRVETILESASSHTVFIRVMSGSNNVHGHVEATANADTGNMGSIHLFSEFFFLFRIIVILIILVIHISLIHIVLLRRSTGAKSHLA